MPFAGPNPYLDIVPASSVTARIADGVSSILPGDWDACARIARGPAYAPLFRHLIKNPRDFRGALQFVPLRLRVIHAFAYQSYLWNRALSGMLRGGQRERSVRRVLCAAQPGARRTRFPGVRPRPGGGGRRGWRAGWGVRARGGCGVGCGVPRLL